MKYLLVIFLFIPFFSFAQTDEDMGQGLYYKTDCYRFMMRKFAKKTGTMENLAKKLIKSTTRTIYVIKTPDIDSLPKEVNGIVIKLVDADSNFALLREEQKTNDAVVLYISKILNYINFYDFSVIPVKMTRKELSYEKESCNIRFEYNMGTSKFEHVKTECKEW